MYTLDPTWLPFSNLMLRHIYNVLLICSDYDRFLLEEDGRVEEELYLEYTQLGLNNPPKITHTNTGEEALKLLGERKFDLVITMLDLGSDPVEQLAFDIKAIQSDMPIIVLSPSSSHRRNKMIKGAFCPAIDYFFYWQGDPTIFLAMIKLVEDSMNVEHDTQEADVQVIILVEDSIRFYSSYLPLMYTCLIQQNRSSILEALNNWGKTLRMRGRPKIVLARTYEEAFNLYNRYRHNILGVISDMSYSHEGIQDKKAGMELAKNILADNPEIPILIQSTDLSLKESCEDFGVSFIWKLSPTLLAELNKFMNTQFGFGPFIFRDPKTLKELARAETMRDLQRLLPTIPPDSFAFHCRRNEFSRWLRAQSLYILASKIKNLQLPEKGDLGEVQQQLIEIIRNYRTERTKGVIAQFSRNNYDETLFFSRIGSGSLGGKGRGLAFIDMELRSSGILDKYPDIYLSIPRTVVLTTDQFSQFIEENALSDIISSELPDETLLKIFLSKPLSSELVLNLAEIIQVIKQPISVRSSSLLEDSHFQPFAGVYETCMIPNTGPDRERLEELCDAIRCVWASTYFHKAKEYLKATDHMMEDEKMAVVIQQVIGSEHGTYWYPNISGVARSLNYYPIGGEKTEDGVGMLSFGFGKSVVDNGSALRFSPTHPKHPVQFLGSNQVSSQNSFYGLNLHNGYHPLEKDGPENLELLDLSEAEKYPESLRYIASTYDLATGTLTESTRAKGFKTITFNGILKYDAFPLAAIVQDILLLGTKAMSTPIEIEFAVNLNRKAPKKPEFSLLQIRPIAQGNEGTDVHITKDEQTEALVYSTVVMGNGKISDIRDLIYIKQETFDPAKMQAMAQELDRLNATMVLEEKDYALIVAGRLGSCDPWLGIPVSWSQISRSRVIVETGFPGFQVEPSQGTHFFQNMTSLGCIYMTVNPSYQAGNLDLSKLQDYTLVEETKHFRHIRTKKPLTIKVNGLKGEGVICL
ncbi:PEP/pyruvate-binding domain-containing protein [uncultured Sphaerochaeta sp.]|uniref:PEP/pyruvate-binding domain-containing protein n=1 Tax=uncultured Sphaerochaeta sp. TaxID=886478 RepID=UPI002A0A685C|nr:PEP/pyruvate-binding domain-containing protein [uncultured Sphaerochaeta sp.]